jgi:hypothetical protein
MKTRIPLIITAVCAACVVSANGAIIVSHTFAGDGGLDGVTATFMHQDVIAAGGSSTWSAGPWFRASGMNNSGEPGHTSAFLTLGNYINSRKGTSEGIFNLTVTIGNIAGSYLTLGYAGGALSTTNEFSGNNGVGTIIYRGFNNPGELDMFGGVGSANELDGPDGLTGPRTLTSSLDFTAWNGTTNFGTVTWSDSVIGTLGSFAFTFDPNVEAILLSEWDWSAGYFSNLSLEQVPEPSTALLGGIGLLALLRRRR